MKTEELLQQMDQAKKLATIDTDAWDFRSKPSIEATKKQAQENLVEMVKEYSNRVLSNTLGIFLSGEQAKQQLFAEIAGAEAGALVFDADAMYRRIAIDMEPSIGPSRQLGMTQQTVLIANLRIIGQELGVASLPIPKFSESDSVAPDLDALAKAIKNSCRRAFGEDLNILSLRSEIVKQAQEKKLAAPVTAVVILGTDSDEAEEIGKAFTKSVSVSLGTGENGEVTQETVLKQLNSINKKLKNKTT